MALRLDRDRVARLASLVALFLLAAVTTRLLLSGWAVDPDALFHVAAGRWMVQHHAIPTNDPLSWYGLTHHTRWLPHEWLFDVTIYLAWRSLGFQGVFALTSVIVGAAVLAARRLAELRGASWLRSLAVALVAVAVMGRFVSPRPGVVTFLLLPLMAVMLEQDRWVPALVLFVLGMNFHGGTYPLYLLVVLYYASPKKPWMLLVASGLVLAQPLGFAVLKYPFFTLDPLNAYIRDFNPTLVGADFVFLTTLAACWLLLDRERTSAKDMIAAAVLITLSLRSVRNQAYFFLLGLPLLAPSFHLPLRPKKSLPADPELAALAKMPRRKLDARTLDLAIFSAMLVCVVVVGARIPRTAVDVDRGYPSGAVSYVKAHGITRFWNEWNDGGYIMLRELAPFVDGRTDPFASFFNPGTKVGLDYMRSYRLESDIRPLLRRYRIDHLIVHRSSQLYRVLEQSADFRLVYQDSAAGVFAFTAAR